MPSSRVVPPEIPAFDPASPVLKAYSCYRSLIQACGSDHLPPEPGFGGKLLYAGVLDQAGRAITIAGNVAGCATLAATADPGAQKQAIRDGIVDFLVTTLDEALRILKNEIRKHATVAVCVGASPSEIEREMLERGVQPDLTRNNAATVQIELGSSEATVVWHVEASPAKWLPHLDAIALESLDPADTWNRRWIRLAPRYLARVAPNLRTAVTNRELAAGFIEKIQSAIDREEIGTAATIWISSHAGQEEHHFSSPRKS